MKFLIISDGVIDNIIESEYEFAQKIGAKEYYYDAKIGDSYAPPDPDKLFRDVALLSAVNTEITAENKLLSQQVSALTDQNDFQEELIVELASVVYA